MAMLKYLALCALFCAAVVSAEVKFEEEGDVIVLTDDNFEDVVKAHAPILIEFYAPWCGHCKALTPEYEKAAAVLKEEGIRIAKLDATQHKTMATQYEIQGFPTLKLFKAGMVLEYDGGRTKDSIISWMRKKTGPPCVTVETVEDLEKLQEKNEVLVVGLYDDLESSQKIALDNVADVDSDNTFAVTSSTALKEHLKVEGNGIVLLKKFDELRNDYEGDLEDLDSISQFIGSNSMPLVTVFTSDNAKKIFGGDYNTQVLVFMDLEKHDSKDEALAEVAKRFKGQAIVIVIPFEEDRIVNYFDVKEDDLPMAIVVKMGDGGIKKYNYDVKGEAIKADGLGAFVQDFFDGKVKPTLKSEPVPESQEEAVYKLVGKSFNDVVIDHGGKQDVLVEFYAPWCGHCKSLAPKYKEVAEMFDGVDSVIIAAMDSTANEIDHPEVNVQGFPTLKFFPATSPNSPIEFDGSRDVDGIVSFLKKHVTIPFDLDGDHFGPTEAKDEL